MSNYDPGSRLDILNKVKKMFLEHNMDYHFPAEYNHIHRRASDRFQDGKKDRRSKRGRQYRSRFGEFLCAGRRDYDRI